MNLIRVRLYNKGYWIYWKTCGGCVCWPVEQPPWTVQWITQAVASSPWRVYILFGDGASYDGGHSGDWHILHTPGAYKWWSTRQYCFYLQILTFENENVTSGSLFFFCRYEKISNFHRYLRSKCNRAALFYVAGTGKTLSNFTYFQWEFNGCAHEYERSLDIWFFF